MEKKFPKTLDPYVSCHYNPASLQFKGDKPMQNNRFFFYSYYFGSRSRVPLAVFKQM